MARLGVKIAKNTKKHSKQCQFNTYFIALIELTQSPVRYKVKMELYKSYNIMNEFSEIIKSDKPVLVDFFATWCGPCKMQSPILDQVKERIGDKGSIVKVDIDRNNELAAKYRVQSVPTLILFKNGEPVWRTVGVQQAELLTAKIFEHAAGN